MHGLREYNRKLKGFENTHKITKTMRMVAVSKLRKAHEAQMNAKFYAQNVTALISRLSSSVDSAKYPLLQIHPVIKNVLILVITSDRGLCGAFNHNAHRRIQLWMKENGSFYDKIEISFCGKKGFQYFQRKSITKKYYERVVERPQFMDAERIGQDLTRDFLSREYDEVYLVYNQFISPLSQRTIFEKILPVDFKELNQANTPRYKQYIFEPAHSDFFEYLLLHYLYFKIYFALLENSAGEHAARMSTMDNASKNVHNMIERYTLLRNKARQEQITKELIEITAGKEALN